MSFRGYDKSEDLYTLWFNTCPIEADDEQWVSSETVDYTTDGIKHLHTHLLTHVDHMVTHAVLRNNIPPNMDELFPRLGCLRIGKVVKNANWDSLFCMEGLEMLNVSENALSEKLACDIFFYMDSLKELNMENCKLETLSRSISDIENLEVLNISRNNLSEGLHGNIFESLLKLRELYMHHCDLVTLPKSTLLLTELEVLDIQWNDFSDGLPDGIFTFLSQLRELHLGNCRLKTLSNDIESLQKLEKLSIAGNGFTALPLSVCGLLNLRELDVSYNTDLKSLDAKIIRLGQLRTLQVENCESLASPPLEICKRGVDAVRQYYTDLAKGAGRSLPFATVAVLGNTMAGKTSLIRTLQNADKKRILTDRSPDAVKDETTKVFNVEEVEVDGTVLRLIDMGGQEVYHITYQLTLKQNCIPVIVVNMEQYDQISKELTCKKAVRRLAFDYMSHLYLANPTLGAPKLILTHKDKYPSAEFQKLRQSFLDCSNQLCRKIVNEEKALGGDFARIGHFNKSPDNIFLAEDIYEIGNDDKYAVFNMIRESLLQSSQDFIKPLPQVWEEVNEGIAGLPSAYHSFWYILLMLRTKQIDIESKQLEIILTYMHDCGKILWYKDIDSRKPYIFPKITEITSLLCVLYYHDYSTRWKSRIDQFLPYVSPNGQCIEKQEFAEYVNHFTNTGLMMDVLLIYLIEKETSFKVLKDVEVAICLLKAFRLLHGPIKSNSEKQVFIMPQFANDLYKNFYFAPKSILLKAETKFNGLALPEYIYHQMTIGLLELFPYEFSIVKVKKNGVNVYQDGIYIQLVHDSASRKVVFFVSSNAINTSKMWERLVTVTNNSLRHVLENWTASRPVTACYCAHCLLLERPCPTRLVNPQWCVHSLKHLQPDVKLSSGSSTILCEDEEIPTALLHPCEHLSEKEADYIKDCVNQMKLEKEQSATALSDVVKEEMLHLQAEDDEISECSDIEDRGYADFTQSDLEPFISLIEDMELKPTTNEKIKKLFSNHKQVYAVSNPVQGRAMIINYERFFTKEGRENTKATRHGSHIDYYNIKKLFKDMGFVVVKEDEPMFDLTKEETLAELKMETDQEEHNHLSMFVLVIMSHGTLGNVFYDRDCTPVNLSEIKELLSASKFPAMGGKPKLIIFHACSGSRSDFGTALQSKSSTKQSPTAAPLPSSPSTVSPDQHTQSNADFNRFTHLDVDDFYIVKPSAELYKAGRHDAYGTWFIRILVATFYKHSCHRDVDELFKIIQDRVRQVSIAYCKKTGDQTGGNVPTRLECSFTHLRKLFFFPKFPNKLPSK